MTHAQKPWSSHFGAASLALGLFACGAHSNGNSEGEGAPARAPIARTIPARAASEFVALEGVAHVVSGPASLARPTPPFRGRIEAIHVRAGDRVEAGAPLLDVSMPEVLVAAARLRTSASRRTQRQVRRTALADLQAEGLVERGRVFEEETAVANLDAERAEALAVLRAASVSPTQVGHLLVTGHVTITSPIAGVVRDVYCAVGEVHDPASGPVVEVVGAASARVEARFTRPLPQSSHDGVEDSFAVTFLGANGQSTSLQATPDSTLVDPIDGTLVAWFHPTNGAPLSPGLAGRITVALHDERAIEIPGRALFVDNGHSFVERFRADTPPVRVEVQVLEGRSTVMIVRASVDGELLATDSVSLLPSRESQP